MPESTHPFQNCQGIRLKIGSCTRPRKKIGEHARRPAAAGAPTPDDLPNNASAIAAASYAVIASF